MASITIHYGLAFGASLRVGYRIQNSSSAFTYLTTFPTYNDSPFTFDGLALGNYEVELTTICPSCSGGIFSDPEVYPAQAV